jgi:DNA-binding CsgD family transcriptional regulator
MANSEKSKGLTPREKEILILLADGYNIEEISQKLGIALPTVSRHRATIGIKLKTNNVAGLVKYALKHGLTTLD